MKHVLQLGEREQGRLKILLPTNATLLTYNRVNNKEGVIRHVCICGQSSEQLSDPLTSCLVTHNCLVLRFV